jgi:hypothetical protein
MTRFNVPTKGWDETRSGFKPLTEEWLDDQLNYSEPMWRILIKTRLTKILSGLLSLM